MEYINFYLYIYIKLYIVGMYIPVYKHRACFIKWLEPNKNRKIYSLHVRGEFSRIRVVTLKIVTPLPCQKSRHTFTVFTFIYATYSNFIIILCDWWVTREKAFTCAKHWISISKSTAAVENTKTPNIFSKGIYVYEYV